MPPPAKPTNIIFILLDDLGWRDLSCYGSSFYETPNIDRLASGGMLFTNAYASAPVCSPTRASLLTGKYPANVGVTNYIGGHAVGKLCDVPFCSYLPTSEVSIAKALQEGGYHTWHVGKWHLGNYLTMPKEHGFDINVGGCEWGHPKQGYFSPWGIPTLKDGPQGEYLTDRLTDEATRLIRERDTSKPYFLNLWHYAVHTPIQAPQELVDKYIEKAQRLGLNKIQAIEEGEFFPTQQFRHRRLKRRIVQSDPAYAAMIENLDTNIGRLMDAVKEDALVVFTSDNGGLATAEGSPTCNAPLAEGKGWMYEGGTREPLIVHWPGKVSGGSQCEIPVTSPDLYPTFLQAAGLPLRPSQHCDGESLMPLLTQEGSLHRDAIFWHYPHYGNQGGTPGCSMRSGDWKLIEFFEDGRLELYCLRDDESEKHNRAPEEPARVATMKSRLDEWKVSVGALIPKRNCNWQD